MVTIKTVVPPPADTQGLTSRQKAFGVFLLLFYLLMIGVTIATSPYVTNVGSRSIFERARD